MRRTCHRRTIASSAKPSTARSPLITLHGDETLVAKTKRAPENAGISAKLKGLLAIAGKVQKGGKYVKSQDIERATEQGADLEIHDTVLIAAAFCMYNRYVDWLAIWAPQDPNLARDGISIPFADGHTRRLPRFTDRPFRYTSRYLNHG